VARDIELTVRPDVAADAPALRRVAARAAGMSPEDIGDVQVLRRAIDARRGVRFHLRLRLFRHDEAAPALERPVAPTFPPPARGRPVIVVGDGPAGIFAAFRLAGRGVPALILERGKPIAARRRDIAALNKRGEVDPESNYCFGEGGAGAYSDGKLYTRAHKRGPVEWVMRQLVAHGADPAILVDARPHIGSNRLPKIVSALRETLAAGGVETRFEARVTDLVIEHGRAAGVRLANGTEIEAAAVILATGHSARDVYAFVARAGVPLETKAFAVGVRVEHPQPVIDQAQYGPDTTRFALPPASYRLATTVRGRGVFSFCMCPGGWIVPATTAPDLVVLNGMSLARRDSPFANSGIVVALEPADVAALGYGGAAGGIELQVALERRAYEAGGGAQVAPAQRLRDFMAGRESADLPRCSYVPGICVAPLDRDLPGPIAERLRDAFRRFARQLRGYDTGEAVAVGVETRSSSPVRVLRDPRSLASPAIENLYPCGEGAGYAGGIVSAALDGLAVAEVAGVAYAAALR